MQASTRRFEAGPTGLAADPHAGWVPEAACPDSQQLGRFLNHSRVAHHLCKAGAAYGTCEAIRQQLQGCSGAASGRFTTRTQPRRLRCGVDTCCPHWRTDACWACGLKWHSPTSASPPHCPSSLPMRWLGRAEIEECARGKLLIFQGDSLTRQLFNRLIWWVRGIPSVVEHYYQEDAYYAFSEQAGDAFTLRRHSYARGKLDAAAVATNAEIAAKWARVDAAVAGNATLDPQQVHVLYQAFRNSKYPIDDDIAGGRFMSARVRRGQVQWDKWERRDRCDHEHPEGCAVREREGGGASAVPWDPARLLGLVQGQMGQLVIHRARPEGDGWDRAAFNVRVVAESSPLLLERNSVCFTTTRKGENGSSIELEKVLEGHKITHSDHGLSRLPPMCTHEDGHFQCSFSRIDGRRVDFFKRPPYISLPLSGDCRDLSSLNTVQLILSALCGVRDGVRDGVRSEKRAVRRA